MIINTNRRQFLQVTAGSAAAVLLSGGNTSAAEPDGGWIDAHSHIWTSDVAKYPLAGGQGVEVLQPRDFTDEQLIAAGKPLGVTRFVLIQHKPHHGLDNSYIVDAIARHPGVFSAVACVEAAGPRPDDDMRRLATQGVRGFRIRPGEGGAETWEQSPGMCATWQCAGETGLAICPLINPEDLPQVDAMCRRYPDANVVIDHFARIGIDGEIHEADLQRMCDLSRHSRTHVKVSAYYALGKKMPPYDDLAPMIERLLETYGPERLMWATDSPYQLTPPNSYAASLELVRDRLEFLSETDREHLLRKTAEKVFFGHVAV
ncbi:MAG: amidohydrolase [Planctomycetaceae bacterium]|nr:amidohydrolase [Planctomycetaceae bacterium]